MTDIESALLQNQLQNLGTDCRGRLAIYGELLAKWQKKINLVGPSTLDDLWLRHFADSLQLLPLAGEWRNWVDLGSGGGFPGLVVAIAAGGAAQMVHLIEADKRKAAFLREVSRETQTDAAIHVGRIEQVLPQLVLQTRFDIVSARALAPLETLVRYARPALEKGALGLFMKGKGLSGELTAASGDDSLTFTLADSLTDAEARIVIVRGYDSQTRSV